MAAGAAATASLIDAWVSPRLRTALGTVKSQPSPWVTLVGLGDASCEELLLQPRTPTSKSAAARTFFTDERLHGFGDADAGPAARYFDGEGPRRVQCCMKYARRCRLAA